MHAVLVDAEIFWRPDNFRNAPTVFDRSFERSLFAREEAGVSFSGVLLASTYWPRRSGEVTKTGLSK